MCCLRFLGRLKILKFQILQKNNFLPVSKVSIATKCVISSKTTNQHVHSPKLEPQNKNQFQKNLDCGVRMNLIIISSCFPKKYEKMFLLLFLPVLVWCLHNFFFFYFYTCYSLLCNKIHENIKKKMLS